MVVVTIDLSLTLHIAWRSESFVLHDSPFLQDTKFFLLTPIFPKLSHWHGIQAQLSQMRMFYSMPLNGFHCKLFLIVLKIPYYRMASVIMTRLMLNLRDPTFISTSERNTSENTTYPDLTFVESHCPTQFSDRGGFAESESRGGDEEWTANLYLHRPAGKHLVFPLVFLWFVSVSYLFLSNFLGNDIELHRTGVWPARFELIIYSLSLCQWLYI